MIRFCVRCAQAITFDWQELPVVDNRRNMRVVARFYVHPSTAACDAEVARQRTLDLGVVLSEYDMGIQRARYLRNLIAEATIERATEAS